MARLVALVVALVLVADAALCALIVARVPYNEIDWRAYMAQVRARIAAPGGRSSAPGPSWSTVARGTRHTWPRFSSPHCPCTSSTPIVH